LLFVVNVPLIFSILPEDEQDPVNVTQLRLLIVKVEANVTIIQPVMEFDGVKVKTKLLLDNNVGEENVPDKDTKFDVCIFVRMVDVARFLL
jgi:hypothetical protein